MDLTDHVVQQGAEADRREVNPTIQVETATLPRLSGPASPGPTGLGLVEKAQCFSEDECEDEEREENALGLCTAIPIQAP
jgi:hypothetical protein